MDSTDEQRDMEIDSGIFRQNKGQTDSHRDGSTGGKGEEERKKGEGRRKRAAEREEMKGKGIGRRKMREGGGKRKRGKEREKK